MDITDQELSHQETTLSENQGRVLLLACGALAREILDIINRHGFTHLDLKCLPAILHNAPEKITPLIEEKIAEHRAAYDDIYVLYADCGTGGLLQAACDRLGVENAARILYPFYKHHFHFHCSSCLGPLRHY